MIRTHVFLCSIAKNQVYALNRESGHIFRYIGQWLSNYDIMRLNDSLSVKIFYVHTRDAAQQAFYKAYKTVRANRGVMEESRYLHRSKCYCTTIWKSAGIRKRDGKLLLELTREIDMLRGDFLASLVEHPQDEFLEMSLVWNRSRRRYNRYLVVKDGI